MTTQPTARTKSYIKQPPSTLERVGIALASGVLLFLAAATTVIVGFQLLFLGRVFPGVYVGQTELSSMGREAASELLAEQITYPQTGTIVVSYQDESWVYSPYNLGLSFDAQANAQVAYQVGRQGWPWERLAEQYQALMIGVHLPPQMTFDGQKAQDTLDEVAAQINRPTVEAALAINGLEVVAQPGQIGRTMDVWTSIAVLEGQLRSLQDGEVALIVNETPPAILDASEQAALAEQILSRDLTIEIPSAYDDDPGPWTFTPQQLAEMLVIERVAHEDGARYQVGLEAGQLAAFLTEIAPEVARDPENTRFIFNDDTRLLEVIKPAIIGRTLQIEASIEQINRQIGEGASTVELAFDYDAPAVTDEMTGAELGITELVSSQTTYFFGSSSARIQNIQTAAARFHGLLIPPGATFSMVENLGDITLDSGYAEAWIIFGDRTIKGVGGGVCQVSTTLFRTVFFGGFPIVERYSHSYRVAYYEQSSSGAVNPQLAGLDATVYAPIVDFKFTNDTPYWLLMETYVIPGSRSLTWKFYSTSDGRTMSWDTSGLKNRVDPPDPVYEESPDLAKGETKQVDWAVEGADVTITRVVYRDGEVLYNDEFRTHYLPWAAVCQYGEGTKGYPPDKPQDPEDFCK